MGRNLGLRIQILVALTLLLALSFFPLFFAITRVTRATLLDAHEGEARSIAEALAVRADAARASGASLDDLLTRQAEAIPLEAAAIFDREGRRLTSRGEHPPENAHLATHGGAEVVRSGAHSIDIVASSGETKVALRLWSREVHRGIEAVQQLVALYMGLFATVLLAFAYFALTRLLVRPIESLVRDTERIANGSRTPELPTDGPREVVRLSQSITVMARSLLSKEDAMRKKVDELTRTTKQLAATETQLVGSEHMASVGRLAAGVAHEIGNPISAILGMEELLLGGGLEREEERDFLARMKRETERVHTVLRDLLDYARAGRTLGASEVDAGAAADANAIAADVIALVRPQKDFKSVDLSRSLEDGLVLAIPPARLTQVLLNIVLNAGAALQATKDPVIRILGRREGDRGVIRVEDNGPGVPEGVRELIFDPFFTTKDVGQGTGLGLSVCRGIVLSHGGAIRLDTQTKAGAAFEIELPLTERVPSVRPR